MERTTHDHNRLRTHAEAVAQDLSLKHSLIGLILATRTRLSNQDEDERLVRGWQLATPSAF